MGSVDLPFVSRLVERLGGRNVAFETFDILAADELVRCGGEVLLHALVTGVEMQGGRIVGVRVAGKARALDVRGAVFVDATGDGDVAFLAGAQFEQGREKDGLVQPTSIMFRLSGVDEKRALCCGSEEQALAVKVGGRTWHEIVADAQARGELPAAVGVVRVYAAARAGERVVNATQVNRIDGTDPWALTRAELEGRRQAQQVFAFLRRHAPGYEDALITGMPFVVGVRETRRVVGVERLTREDVVTGRKRPDAVVRSACFPIDIHNPDGGGQAEGFAARAQPYDIPLGCLVPQSIDGLLLSGRCISGSHDAHASYRVMIIAMATGAAAGAAAVLAQRQGVQPRELDAEDVRRVLADRDNRKE
jgi:hypothetical protein